MDTSCRDKLVSMNIRALNNNNYVHTYVQFKTKLIEKTFGILNIDTSISQKLCDFQKTVSNVVRLDIN